MEESQDELGPVFGKHIERDLMRKELEFCCMNMLYNSDEIFSLSLLYSNHVTLSGCDIRFSLLF